MTILVARVARTRWIQQHPPICWRNAMLSRSAQFSTYIPRLKQQDEQQRESNHSDARISDLGRAIENDFASIREKYGIFSIIHCTCKSADW
jgi:hypothetical protein